MEKEDKKWQKKKIRGNERVMEMEVSTVVTQELYNNRCDSRFSFNCKKLYTTRINQEVC